MASPVPTNLRHASNFCIVSSAENMGINKLWNVSTYSLLELTYVLTRLQLLEPAAQVCSLTELAVQEGFETNHRGRRSIIIGVDVR